LCGKGLVKIVFRFNQSYFTKLRNVERESKRDFKRI
jgi:hypothetical protein